MTRLKDYIIEKINQKEFEEVLNSKDIQAGCEFEFYISTDHSSTYFELEEEISLAEEERTQASDVLDSFTFDIQELDERLDNIDDEKKKLTGDIDDLTRRIEWLEDDIKNITYDMENGLFKDRVAVDANVKALKDKNDEIKILKAALEDKKDALEDAETFENIGYNENKKDLKRNILDYFQKNNYAKIQHFKNLIDDYANIYIDDEIGRWISYGSMDKLDYYINFDEVFASRTGDLDKEDLLANNNFPVKIKGGWEVEDDSSLDSDDGVGIEVITPILSVRVLIANIKKIFEWISENGFTDNTTGFHVHMSSKTGEIDPLKLILFTEEDLIYKHFEMRKKNTYTKGKKVHFDYLEVDTDDLLDIASNLIVKKKYNSEKYMGLHLYDLQDNHIEFRYMGGRDYHEKFDEVRQIIINYAHWLSIACDPEYKKKEYIKKVNRLINKLEYDNINETIRMFYVYVERYVDKVRFTQDAQGKMRKIASGFIKPLETKLKSLPAPLKKDHVVLKGQRLDNIKYNANAIFNSFRESLPLEYK